MRDESGSSSLRCGRLSYHRFSGTAAALYKEVGSKQNQHTSTPVHSFADLEATSGVLISAIQQRRLLYRRVFLEYMLHTME